MHFYLERSIHYYKLHLQIHRLEIQWDSQSQLLPLHNTILQWLLKIKLSFLLKATFIVKVCPFKRTENPLAVVESCRATLPALFFSVTNVPGATVSLNHTPKDIELSVKLTELVLQSSLLVVLKNRPQSSTLKIIIYRVKILIRSGHKPVLDDIHASCYSISACLSSHPGVSTLSEIKRVHFYIYRGVNVRTIWLELLANLTKAIASSTLRE